MATPTLDDLLNIPTQQAVLDQEVFPELQLRKVRITDWLIGGVYRTAAYLVSRLYVNSRTVQAAVAAGGFEDWAFGFATPPNGIDVTGWAPLIAKQRYGVPQILATPTKRIFRLTNSLVSGYGPIGAGRITVQTSAAGHRYISDEDITIPGSGTNGGIVDAVFRSEFPFDSAGGYAYNSDPTSDTGLVLVTADFPGVTVTNPPQVPGVNQVGPGLGKITPGGTLTETHTVAVRIAADGNVGAGTWQIQLDNGAWSSATTIGTTTIGGSGGITITPANNGGSPAFKAGTVYYFHTPGTDITVAGRDTETPQELGARCYGLRPALGFVKDPDGNWIPVSPTASAYETLARSASDEVKVCFVQTSPTVNNQVFIYVAGQGTLLPSGVVSLLQAFFDHFTMTTDRVLVAEPAQRTITLGGATVKVKAAQLASAQAALQTAIGAYLGGSDVRSQLSINGLIDRSYIAALIRSTPGVTHVDDGLTINTAAADLQLPVTPDAYELATWSQLVSSAFTWITV
jgi:hypothetical protein